MNNDWMWAYYFITKPDREIADLTETVNENPESADAYFRRGLAYFRQKKYYNALEDFKGALRLDPRNRNIDTYVKHVKKLYEAELTLLTAETGVIYL